MTTEPVLNVPLLTKVLDHITAHPAEWNQGVWAEETTCGTAACVAGWAVIMSGHPLVFEANVRMYDPDSLEISNSGPCARFTANNEYIADVARHELGLTKGQAECLFDSANKLDSLWQMANAYSDGEIQRLSEVSA